MKIVVALMLLLILASLFSALFFMMRKGGNRSDMVRALSLRIGLSVLLFICLLLARHFGLISSGGYKL
jgi:hypothetical protein